jgi:RNA polymerase sigma-70 factor, ECF subfamily
VLILRDVLGFSARETATALDTTPVSVDSALQRAHKTVDQRLPEQSQQATLRSLSDDGLRQVVQRYVTAWERNDVDAVVAMLAEDAKLAMPPLPTWYRGREHVASFLSGGPLAGATRWRLIPTRANGQLAFGLYAWDDKTQTFTPRAIDVLALRGAQIQEITAFLSPDAFRNFDLPAILPASGTSS